MPYPNEHVARIKSPNLFIKDSMRSKTLNEGLRIIAGKLKNKPDKMTRQSYRFKKDKFTVEQSKKWLSDNNIEYNIFEPALKTVQSFRDIKLQCTALSLHPQEIKNHIPLNVLAEIKNKNSNPYFRAYSIMQDGIAKPRIIGESNVLPTKWSRKIVESLKKIVKRGVQFFIGHNDDNSIENRKSVGEVISNFQKKIGNKLHNIVIGYFPDKISADQYDVCSIEGNILAQDYDDYSIVKQVKNITGIALGNSAYDKPAFPGAVYLGSIQAFDDDNDDSPSLEKNKSEEITMTFEEIKQAVKDKNIFPAQLYTEDDLKQDRTFGKLFDQIEVVSQQKTEFETQLEAKENEIKKLQKDITLVTANDKLSKSLPDGLTDSQKTFIEKRFKPETMEDVSEENLKSFVDNSLEEFSEYASIFGIDKTDTDPVNNSDNDKTEDEIDQIVNEVVTKT